MTVGSGPEYRSPSRPRSPTGLQSTYSRRIRQRGQVARTARIFASLLAWSGL